MRNLSNDRIILKKSFEKNLIIFEKFLNIVFVNVTISQNLTNSRKRNKNYKTFSFLMKKIMKLFEITRNDNSKKLSIHIVIEIITIILKQYFFFKF